MKLVALGAVTPGICQVEPSQRRTTKANSLLELSLQDTTMEEDETATALGPLGGAGVPEGAGVRVAVGLAVVVAVARTVGVTVSVAAGVGVAVRVGVMVGVAAGVAAALGVGAGAAAGPQPARRKMTTSSL